MVNYNRQYEMIIRPLGKSQADEYHHNGAIWIEGREGNHYTIEIKNNTYGRAFFALSVDGLDVMDGKTAGLDSRGYVLNAFQSISIPGWSLNKDKIAEFYFSRNKNSYVNEIGGATTNTGVIGAMIFSEKIHYNYSNIWSSVVQLGQPFVGTQSTVYGGGYVPISTSIGTLKGIMMNSSASLGESIQNTETVSMMNASVSPEVVSQDIGTGFGREVDFKTVEVDFEKANPTNPDCILAVYYNTARNLEKMGISLRRKHNVEHKANPFPNYSSPSTGCKPPSNWRK